jgi:hypothetical protein
MTANILPNTLALEGVLDEEVNLDHLFEFLNQLKTRGLTPPVSLDFSKVPYANSSGIVTWLKFTRDAKICFKYVNAPVWLVNRFNMVKGYFPHDSFVDSFCVPYYAPKTQESCTFTLRLGKDIPILNDYSNFKIPNRIVDGKEYEIDFMPEKYLSFVVDNFSSFKEKIK